MTLKSSWKIVNQSDTSHFLGDQIPLKGKEYTHTGCFKVSVIFETLYLCSRLTNLNILLRGDKAMYMVFLCIILNGTGSWCVRYYGTYCGIIYCSARVSAPMYRATECTSEFSVV